jgi:drug/metabolite transporter superfamily protein YnfA
MKWQEAGKNCVMRSSIISTSQEGINGRTYSAHGKVGILCKIFVDIALPERKRALG